MKKTNLMKSVSVIILSVMLVLMCTVVNAADSNGFSDISGTLNPTNNSSNTANTNTSNNSTNTNNTSNTNTNNTTNNTNNASNNNSSVYNNTNLPKTGTASTLPIAALVVIFGISAVYAYKKVSDYKNI